MHQTIFDRLAVVLWWFIELYSWFRFLARAGPRVQPRVTVVQEVLADLKRHRLTHYPQYPQAISTIHSLAHYPQVNVQSTGKLMHYPIKNALCISLDYLLKFVMLETMINKLKRLIWIYRKAHMMPQWHILCKTWLIKWPLSLRHRLINYLSRIYAIRF